MTLLIWQTTPPFIWGALVLLALLTGGLIWLWYLQRQVTQRSQALKAEVEQRRRVERSLRTSEERFRSMFEESPIGISLVDGAGNILESNQAFAGIVGYTRAELLSMTGGALTYPEDLEKEMILVKALWSGEIGDYTMIKRYLHKDGARIWAHVHVTLLKTGADQTRYALAFVENLTERHKMENALRESEKQFKLFMRYLPGAVFIKDPEGRLKFCNKRYAELVNQTPDEIIGKMSRDYLPAEAREDHSFERENAQVLAEHQPIIFEHTFSTPMGFTYWLTYKFPIPREGEKSLLGAMSLDITERRQVEEQLKEREERLQALFENALNAILVIDDKGEFVMVNPAAAEMFGISRELFKQAHLSNLKTPPYIDMDARLQQYNQRGQASGEITFFVGDDDERVALYHAVRVRDDFNLCILNDVTERRCAEVALRQLNEELEARIAKRTAELRTMIDAMTGREVRMAELKNVIRALRAQLEDAGLSPIADDPLLGEKS